MWNDLLKESERPFVPHLKQHMLTREQVEGIGSFGIYKKITICDGCNMIVRSGEKHVEKTRGACEGVMKEYWLPANQLETYKDKVGGSKPAWCLLCNKGFKRTGLHDHVKQCHFGMSIDVFTAKFMISSENGHSGLSCVRDAFRHEEPDLSRLWETAQVLRGNKAKGLCAIIKSKKDWDVRSVCALVDAQAYTRFDVRNCLKGNGYMVESRGPEDARYMLVWKEDDVVSVLSEWLPASVVHGSIIPALRKEIACQDAAQRASLAHQAQHGESRGLLCMRRGGGDRHYPHRRVRHCDGCGATSDETEILVSVHFDEQYCDTCIDEDDELSGHKWEVWG
jgi:hypothetical protein